MIDRDRNYGKIVLGIVAFALVLAGIAFLTAHNTLVGIGAWVLAALCASGLARLNQV